MTECTAKVRGCSARLDEQARLVAEARGEDINADVVETLRKCVGGSRE